MATGATNPVSPPNNCFMKVLSGFLRLLRWQNLFFIALTQALYYFCIIGSSFPGNEAENYFSQRQVLFYLLVLASVLIAGAGYIINDYFDLQIDRVNKPDRVVVDRIVKRRWAIVWHLVFSIAGILISIYLSWKTRSFLIATGNVVCVLALWFYSTWFKKSLLVGNILIAALTAWVIVVVYFFAGANIRLTGWPESGYPFDIRRVFKFTMLYAGFAFVISLIREAVKDMEDITGDAKYKCRTMPIVWGIPASKIFCGVWLAVILAAAIICTIYALQLNYWPLAGYAFLFIVIPMGWAMLLLYRAKLAPEFHHLSNWIKFIMLTGILSMLFFLWI